jgi:hypothetical protein
METKQSPTIVKVQVPMFMPEADALIYAEGRARTQTRKLTREEHYQMRDDLRAFFNAWWSEATGWVLLERCADQPW